MSSLHVITKMKNYLLWMMLAVPLVIHYNTFLAQRDHKMFEAYDKVCATLPVSHPECRYAR